MRTHSLSPAGLLAAIVAIVGGTNALADPIPPGRPAVAAPRFTLLLPGKSPESIVLVRLGPESGSKGPVITFLDSAGTRQSVPMSTAIALAPPSWLPTPESVAPSLGDRVGEGHAQRLELTDGQRIIGQIGESTPANIDGALAKASASQVSMRSDRLGMITISTDRVSRFFLDAGRRTAPVAFSTAADTLLLVNEDRVEGFLETLGPKVRIEASVSRPGNKPTVTEIDLDQVEMANLVNPLLPPAGCWVELADGSVLAVEQASLSAQLDSAKLSVRPMVLGQEASPVSLDLNELAGIVPDASRLIPLSSLALASQRPHTSAPRTAPVEIVADAPAPLGASDLLLPGPMSVEWTLPDRLSKGGTISGFAQMDDRSFAWGDCEVVVSIIVPGAPARVLSRGRLNAESPTLALAAELGAAPAGSRLRVQVEPGERGPVQDRVVLRRVLLITGRSA
ncbi:MAG: hypothetical protein K2W85_12585 [Phycisphaerales bacterium]|nr:hypothetical protein [Phycisphaerales bacterium]